MENKLSYISLFSSAGIGCYGFTLEGFDCAVTNELIERRLKIQKYNNKCSSDSGYIVGNITQKEVKTRILEEANEWLKIHKKKEIDVLIATPPCQGMSIANHKKKNELNRNSLVIESLDIVKQINPKYFIFENVKAFLTTSCTDRDKKNKTIKEAIEMNLSGKYNILYKMINFKDLGVPSSRNRTLVLGVRKDLKDITPYDILPDNNNPKTLRQAIGHLPSLKNMGEIYSKDIYHNFRSYDKKMLNWIEDLKEGQSAFENSHPLKRPHRLVNGKIIPNTNKNGDKYSRCYFDKIAPCIHTRNDILASQSTIHPKDNRVFSIRELMIMMSIPNSFNWSAIPEETLNKMNESEKREFLSKNEINIRQSLGEAVPTLVFQQIAQKIKYQLNKKRLSNKEIMTIIKELFLDNKDNLINFINRNKQALSFTDLSKICELANSKRTDMSAYYTSQDICFTIINDLPSPENFTSIRLLEPSVGIGNFLPLLIKKYKDVPNMTIDLIDLNKDVLEILKVLLRTIEIPKNIKINFINEDFIFYKSEQKYDIIVGNPPFKKVENEKKLLFDYKSEMYNRNTNNLFSFFIEKALKLSDYVALITPKSLLSTPEFNKTRELIGERKVLKITDYGELAFDVKIETISMIITGNKTVGNLVKIESYITQETKYLDSNYIMSKEFPYWLIYRNEFFDKVKEKIKFGIFDVFRDRQITKKITQRNGEYRVLKSRNLNKDGEIKDIAGYDCFIDNISNLAVSKFLNRKDIIIVPNLSYYPRAGFMPKNAIADGSIALLIPKGDYKITKKKLEYLSTEEFEKFYKIARNYGTRSLNIDANSVFFWGLLKHE